MNKILVCGGRDFSDSSLVFKTLDAIHASCPIDEIIEGGARGADRLAFNWAVLRGVDVRTFNALWEKHGKAAGIIRNLQMLEEGKPDQVIAFPGGIGTANMVKIAKQAGIFVLHVGKDNELQK